MQLFGTVLWAGQFIKSSKDRYLTVPVYGVETDENGYHQLLVLDDEGGSFLRRWGAEEVIVLLASQEEVIKHIVQFEGEVEGPGKTIFIDGEKHET